MKKKWIALTLVLAMALTLCACSSSDYKKAQSLLESGSYDEAAAQFEALGDYKDSAALVRECRYRRALALRDSGAFEEAAAAFEALGDYKDSAALVQECRYGRALALYAAAELEQAGRAFEALGAYKDAESYARSCAARLDPMSWLQNLIRERGELSTPEGELGSPNYFYELGAPISGPDINESKLELRWFPDADETRLALIKVEPFGETTLSTYANLYFSGEMTVTLFVGNMPTMWTTVRVDPASYTAGGDYEIEQHKHMILRKDPNESYRSELSDMLDSCLELAAQFLEGEAEGVTLADFDFTSYQVDPERVSPLLSGEKTDSRVLL